MEDKNLMEYVLDSMPNTEETTDTNDSNETNETGTIPEVEPELPSFDLESFLSTVLEPHADSNETDATNETDSNNTNAEEPNDTEEDENEDEEEDESDDIDELLGLKPTKKSSSKRATKHDDTDKEPKVEERVERLESIAKQLIGQIQLQQYLTQASEQAIQYKQEMAKYGIEFTDEEMQNAIYESLPLLAEGDSQALQRVLAMKTVSKMAKLVKTNRTPMRERVDTHKTTQPPERRRLIDYLVEELENRERS